jgi:hypothetical protein
MLEKATTTDGSYRHRSQNTTISVIPEMTLAQCLVFPHSTRFTPECYCQPCDMR